MTSTMTPAPAPTVEKKQRRGGGGVGEKAGSANWMVKAAIALICFFWVVPTIGVIITSFRPLDDSNTSGWWSIFTHPSYLGNLTFSNYDQAINNSNLGRGFVNSLAIALPATFIPILVAAFAAYAFTFMSFPAKDTLFIIIVSLLVVPNFVAMVPLLKIYGNLGINGTFPAVWLAHIGFGMSLAIYLLRNYMATLPKSVVESAKVDGASHFATFYRLILPMSVPVLASFAIFQFLWTWNDFLIALTMVGNNPDARPTTILIANLAGDFGRNEHLLPAAAFVQAFVPLIVFFALQRYFVRGMLAGAVKG